MLAIITFCLIIYAIERDINYGLPDYKYEREFGLINGIYIAARIVAPWLMFMGILSWHWLLVVIGIGLYIMANVIKKIAWKLEYGINYKFNFKLK